MEIFEIKRKIFEVVEKLGERSYKVSRKGKIYFLKDFENDKKGFEQYVDTGSKSLRKAYSRYWTDRQKELKDTFTRSNVDNVSIATNEDYVKQLLGLFKQRS